MYTVPSWEAAGLENQLATHVMSQLLKLLDNHVQLPERYSNSQNSIYSRTDWRDITDKKHVFFRDKPSIRL